MTDIGTYDYCPVHGLYGTVEFNLSRKAKYVTFRAIRDGVVYAYCITAVTTDRTRQNIRNALGPSD